MWKIIFTLITLITFSMGASAQLTVKRDANGDYVSTKTKAKPIDTTKYIATGSYYKTKDSTYAVWKSRTGKLVIFRRSKNGNEYKQYLKVEQ